MTGYEIQTNSIRSEIDKCVKKTSERKYGLKFVTNSKTVKREIEILTNHQFKIIVLEPYEEVVDV
ncbi:MAG: hypothetical protein KGH62_03030 [Candidatus Micrarchaeota archaeon]|nr:hypothetical protein [Candidatus Micrarchaeota archaeon]